MNYLQKTDNKQTYGQIAVTLAVITSFLFVYACFFYFIFFQQHKNPTQHTENIRQKCDAAGGVYIEGATQIDTSETLFTLCIPQRAFECVSVE